MSFHDLARFIEKSPAVLRSGLASLNRNQKLFRVAVLPGEKEEDFVLVVSLNHCIGNSDANVVFFWLLKWHWFYLF